MLNKKYKKEGLNVQPFFFVLINKVKNHHATLSDMMIGINFVFLIIGKHSFIYIMMIT